MALTKEQFNNLYNKGLSVEQIIAFESGQTPETLQPQQQKGFLRSVVEDPLKTLVLKPAVRFGQSIGSGIAGAMGFTPEERALAASKNSRILGIDIEGQKQLGAGGGRQIIGDIAKTASYIAPVGRASSALGSLAKGQVLKAGLQGTGAGAYGGALYGFGESVSDPTKKLGQVAMDTALGGALGGASGFVLGSGLGALSKGFQGVRNLKDRSKLEASLTNKYREILNLTQRQQRVESRYNKDVAKFITEELPEAGEFLKKDPNGKLDTSDVVGMMKPKYEAEEIAFQKILASQGKYADLNLWEKKAIAEAKRQFKGTAQDRAIAKIKAEVSAYGRQYQTFDGKNKTLIKSDKFNEIKRDNWSKTKGFGSPEAEIDGQTSFILGDSARQIIEDIHPEVAIRELNGRLGNFAHAIQILENRSGGTLKNGRIGKFFVRILGGIAGSSGGPAGTIAGAITADRIAQMMADPTVSTAIIRRALKSLPKAERMTVAEEAQRILMQSADINPNLMLPPPRPLGSVGNPIITPAPTTYERMVQRSSIQDTNNIPIINESINPIEQTLGQAEKKVNRPNPQAGFVQAYKGSKVDPLTLEARKYKSAEVRKDITATRQTLKRWIDGDPTDAKLHDLVTKNLSTLEKYKPNKPTIVYRAVPDGKEGIITTDRYTSWTTDRLTAQGYGQDAIGQPRKVVATIVEPEDIAFSVKMLDDAAVKLGLSPIDTLHQSEIVLKPNSYNVSSNFKTTERGLMGIPRTTNTSYLYHGTTEARAMKIADTGLLSGKEAGNTAAKDVYLSNTEQYAKSYADRKGGSGGIVLRVKKAQI